MSWLLLYAWSVKGADKATARPIECEDVSAGTQCDNSAVGASTHF